MFPRIFLLASSLDQKMQSFENMKCQGGGCRRAEWVFCSRITAHAFPIHVLLPTFYSSSCQCWIKLLNIAKKNLCHTNKLTSSVDAIANSIRTHLELSGHILTVWTYFGLFGPIFQTGPWPKIFGMDPNLPGGKATLPSVFLGLWTRVGARRCNHI